MKNDTKKQYFGDVAKVIRSYYEATGKPRAEWTIEDLTLEQAEYVRAANTALLEEIHGFIIYKARPMFAADWWSRWREDILQECFLQVCADFPLYDGEHSLTTWFYYSIRTAANRHRDYNNEVIRADFEFDFLAGSEIDPQGEAEAAERAAAIRSWIASLPEVERVVIDRRYVRNMGGNEIAQDPGFRAAMYRSGLLRQPRRLIAQDVYNVSSATRRRINDSKANIKRELYLHTE